MLQLINHPKQTVHIQTCRIYIKYLYVCNITFISPFHFSPPSTPYRRITFFFSSPPCFSSPPSLPLLSSIRGGGSLRQAQPPLCSDSSARCDRGKAGLSRGLSKQTRACACALTHSGCMTVSDPACALSSSPLKSVFPGDQGELTTHSCLC